MEAPKMPEFVDGMIIKEVPEGAKDFVISRVSFKKPDILDWIDSQEGEWVNVDIKRGKSGKLYACKNTWKKPENS